MNIKNQNQESNLKTEIENENQDWNFDNVIWWLYINGYTLDAISNLIGFLKIEEAELKQDKANYKNTLRLIAKITKNKIVNKQEEKSSFILEKLYGLEKGYSIFFANSGGFHVFGVDFDAHGVAVCIQHSFQAFDRRVFH